MAELPKVVIYTDGSTYPTNPGVGAWAAVLIWGGKYKLLAGFKAPMATNNEMETAAVLDALNTLNRPCEVIIMTDSMYVIRGLKALRHGQVFDTNKYLWKQLLSIYRESGHAIKAVHVKGHSGVAENEWANDLAVEAAIYKKRTERYAEGIPQAYERKQERAQARRKTAFAGI